MAKLSVATPRLLSEFKQRELLLLLAAEVTTSSDGAHVEETPEKPYPRALTYLKATAYSVLLPRSYAASTLLMVFFGGV